MSDDAPALIKQAYDVRRTGDAEGSLQLYRRAADAAGDNPPLRAHCLRHIGDLERESGRVAAADTALIEAEALYRSVVSDTLSLANTVRLRALTGGSNDLWREARILYEQAGKVTGLDLSVAMEECDAHLGE